VEIANARERYRSAAGSLYWADEVRYCSATAPGGHLPEAVGGCTG